MSTKFKADLSVATNHENRIIITQKRKHVKAPGSAHYTVSLTRDEASMIAEQLRRHIALLDELERTGLT